MKEATGAASIPERSKYPQAAAMMQPTRSPRITLTVTRLAPYCTAGCDRDMLTGLHDWSTKPLENNDGDEDRESKTDKFGTAPWQRMRSEIRWAVLKDACGRSSKAASRSSCPVLQTALNQGHTDQGDGRTCDDGREELLEECGSHEREADFEQGTKASSS